MKYLIASLLVPSVQILLMLAFTVCALGIGATTLASKLRPEKTRPGSRAPFRRE